jgi:hypothetical protein
MPEQVFGQSPSFPSWRNALGKELAGTELNNRNVFPGTFIASHDEHVLAQAQADSV